MTIKQRLKHLVGGIPYPIGRYFAQVPFSWRLGPQYRRYCMLLAGSERWTEADSEAYAVEHFRQIVAFACQRYPFYRDLYREHGVEQPDIRSINDFMSLPVVTKVMIRNHLHEFTGAYKLNTGGTTGTPFSFYVDKDAWAREWAHMHRIWSFLDYNYRDLNLAFRGRNIGERNFIYNPVHHEYLVNTYKDLAHFADVFIKLTRQHSHYYVHGYPSSVYNFLVEAERVYSQNDLHEILMKIRGVLLQSEFPYEYMTEKFKKYNLPWLSWYGHSEMCILAYDRQCNNQYTPMITYGLAEIQDGHLLGTSYHNYDMPLIRYDTGDIAEAVETTANGLCKSFRITAGRSGDYVTDCNGKQIPLTSLIFGRHHKAFDVVDHLQIHQDKAGEATIYLITKNQLPEDLHALFDLSHVDISFTLAVRSEPILTAAGKLRLKI